MNSGQATGVKLSEVVIARNGDIHASVEPNIPEGIVDIHGDQLATKTGFMTQVDSKVTSPMTISKGLATLATIFIALISGLIGIWLYSVTSAMSYQTVVSRVGEVEKRTEKLEAAVSDIQSLKFSTLNLQNDVKAMRETQQNNEQDRKDLIKNVSDIRILLAQRGLQQ